MIDIMSEQLMALLQDIPGRTMRFGPKAVVFRMGTPVRLVHAVLSGSIDLLRHGLDGSELILQRAEKGSILAEASLHSAHYHCDAVCRSSCETWAMPREELLRRLTTQPDLSVAYMQRLAMEVQRARFQSELLNLKTVASRLDAWIAWYNRVPEKGEWATVSRQIGVSAAALYREFARRRQKVTR